MDTNSPVMYALLVGINEYAQPAVPQLGGCVNDVNAMDQLLRDRFNVPQGNILKLTDRQATYQAIKQAFRDHLIAQARSWAEAGRQGTPPAFLFHYSGHGSQARDETGAEPDGLDETIVPHDSRTRGVYDIKDWELGQLLDELNQYVDNVTVILDCCHSGSGTRDIKPTLVRTRRCAPDLRPQPTQRPAGGGTTRALPPSGWTLGEKYVLLAACRDREEANEHIVGQRQYGAMTYFLVQDLSQAAPDRPRTYRELHERVSQRVNLNYPDQMPQCEGDRDRLTFGGLRPARDVFLNVVDKSGGLIWVDGGLAHGLTEGSQLKLYPPEVRTLDQAGPPIATLSVAEVGAVRSGCRVEDGLTDVPLHARAVIYRLNYGNMQRQVVLDLPGGPDLDALQARLAQDDVKAYVQVVPPDRPAGFRVQLVDGQLELQDASGKRLVAPFPPTDADGLARDLAHVVRYQNALELSNTASTSSLNGAVSLSVKKLDFDPNTQTPVAAPIEPTAGGETQVDVGQRIVLEVTNHDTSPLYFAVFDFSYDWSITQLYPRARGAHEPLAPGKTYSLGLSQKRNEQLAPQLPPEIAEVRQSVKVIATVADADFEVLEQGALKTPYATRRAVTRGDPLSKLLEQAMAGGKTRALGAPPASATDEWTAAQVDFRIRKRAGGL